jgi:hypothetical protein
MNRLQQMIIIIIIIVIMVMIILIIIFTMNIIDLRNSLLKFYMYCIITLYSAFEWIPLVKTLYLIYNFSISSSSSSSSSSTSSIINSSSSSNIISISSRSSSSNSSSSSFSSSSSNSNWNSGLVEDCQIFSKTNRFIVNLL